MRNLCVIPARGGSKRVPRKNIKKFLGKPILTYSIEAALKSKIFSEIMVSTDDSEIAEVAVECGAKVPFMRSEKNSNDFATTLDVLKEVVNTYKEQNLLFDNVCCLYSCSPFTSSRKIVDAYELLKSKEYDSVFPVMPFSFPIQRAVRIRHNNLSFFYPENANKRSQDLEKAYHDAGQFYWMKNEVIVMKNTIITQNTGAIEISELEGQDIDTEMDWQLAELKYKLLNEIS